MGPSMLLRARGLASPLPERLPRATVLFALDGGGRGAGTNHGRRADHRAGRRRQEVQAYSTMTRSLLVLADRLRELQVTRVVMEATSDYWKPVFYLLEASGFDPWLVNAKDVKHLPGRPKTDKLDSVWLCKVAERQMIRPSFVPPPPIRRLRDLTRYRVDLVSARTAEKNRAHPAGGVCLPVQAGQGLQHDVEGAGEQPGPHPYAVHASVGRG